MKSFLSLLLLQVAAVWSAVYVPPGGPVYVNPNAVGPVEASTSEQSPITQTVYGFLDFTTTIGNTVMIFSPQSAPADGGKKPETTSTTSVLTTSPTPKPTVIETRPPEVTTSKVVAEIKPSKAQTKSIEKKSLPPSEVGQKASIVVLSSKVEIIKPSITTSSSSQHQPAPVIHSVVEVIGPSIPPVEIVSSVVEVRASSEEPALAGNNIDPEYDFLARQSTEVIDETYRVINLKSNTNKFQHKHRHTSSSVEARSKVHLATASHQHNPTGLVSKMGSTEVKDGTTIMHETRVIGTYLSGKYAQVLQSSSSVQRIRPNAASAQGPRILKTASPQLAKHKIYSSIEPTPAGSIHEETAALPLEALFSSAPPVARPSRRQPILSTQSASRQQSRSFHRPRPKEQDVEEEDNEQDLAPAPIPRKSSKYNNIRPSSSQRSTFRTNSKAFTNRFGRSSTSTVVATVSVYSEPPTTQSSRRFGSGKINNNRRSRPSDSTSSSSSNSNSKSKEESTTPSINRRGFKPRVQASPVDSAQAASTSLYKFKLSRPSGRWQYKTTPKPRVTIRKGEEPAAENGPTTPLAEEPRVRVEESLSDLDTQGTGSEPDSQEEARSMADGESSPALPTPGITAETIKIEISTPADFSDVYYELATIKSPYTFQVGTIKNTRFITVTSTYEKNLESATVEATVTPNEIQSTEPLTENILATTLADNSLPLDSCVATLPPIGLSGDQETPPLETLTETFSTTQLVLKTHILPVVRAGGNTTRYTLVQSYQVTRFVTAVKTLPPMEVYHFVPSKTLNEFNTRLEEAGSELHLELEFGDENDNRDSDEPAALKALRPGQDLPHIGSDFDLSDVDKTRFPNINDIKKNQPTPKPSPEPPTTPPLSPEQLQQLALYRLLNPGAVPQVITSSRPVYKIETVFESHVLPIISGTNTIYSTLSKLIGTVTKTEYELSTSTLTPPPQIPQIPQLPQLYPQRLQEQFAITSTPIVTQTQVTATESKILKLTFGAKTAYTTLYSTKVVPTLLTTYITQSVPVQPTVPAFPGYFPAPYPQFSYVG